MFRIFLQKVTFELSRKQYKLIYVGKMTDGAEYMALFAKDESPIFSFISIADFDAAELSNDYNDRLNEIMSELLKDNREFFGKAVCVNVLYSEMLNNAGKFADEQETIRDGDIHNIWWYTDGKSLRFGSGQPDKILGIEKYIKNAVDAELDKAEQDIVYINKIENQLSVLKPSGKFPIITAVILAADVFIFLMQLIFGWENNFIFSYGINRELIFSEGQFYRLFTYMFIHSGFEHIAFNGVSLCIYGTRIEKYFGKISFAAIYFLSGLLGGIISALFNSGFAVGASGAIFGLIGAALVLSKKKHQDIGGLGYMTMIIVAVSNISIGMMTANVDNFGHIGGFLGGLITGYAIYRLRKE